MKVSKDYLKFHTYNLEGSEAIKWSWFEVLGIPLLFRKMLGIPLLFRKVLGIPLLFRKVPRVRLQRHCACSSSSLAIFTCVSFVLLWRRDEILVKR
ncbi:hypothetical protein JHK87_001396 [Glycine soja]|nr:hypothetical protein JHK87_001396 [Glycine soja]